jgi:hypothetical protein
MFLNPCMLAYTRTKGPCRLQATVKDPADFHRLDAVQHGKDDDNALTERSSLEEIANSPNSL